MRKGGDLGKTDVTLVFPDNLHKLLSACKGREIFSLLLQRPVSSKGTHASRCFEVSGKFGVSLISFLLTLRFSFSLPLFGFRYIAQRQKKLCECPNLTNGKKGVREHTPSSSASLFRTPVMFPSAVPLVSANLAAAFARSACSLFSLTNALPFLEKIAMSLVGSRIGLMGSSCLVNTVRPSRKGGLRLCTMTCTVDSDSSSKSKSTVLRVATPEVSIRLASHKSLSAFCKYRQIFRL